MERWFGVLLCVFALTAAGEDQSTRGGSKAESIGTATMTADRTIILDLRAQAPDGTVGDARLTYPKSHKDYAAILKHLGGLKPGEHKPVPPWPDEATGGTSKKRR